MLMGLLATCMAVELTPEDVEAKTEDLLAELQQLQAEGKLGETCSEEAPCEEGLTCTGGPVPSCQPLDCVNKAMYNTFLNYPYHNMEDYADYILAEAGLSSVDDAFEGGGWFSLPRIKPEVEAAIIQAIQDNPLPMDEYNEQLAESCGTEAATVDGTTTGGGVILKSSQIFKITYSYYTAKGPADNNGATFSEICFGGGAELGLKVAGLIMTIFSGTNKDLVGNSLIFSLDLTPGIGYGTNIGFTLPDCVCRIGNEIGIGLLGGIGISYCTTQKCRDSSEMPSVSPSKSPSAAPVAPTISPMPTSPTKAPTPEPTTIIDTIVPDTCFSETNEVHVEGKGSVSIRNLEAGDQVLTKEGQYQSIYAFGHRQDNDDLSKFLVIHTDKSYLSALEITPSHMLFLFGDQSQSILARDLRVGDVLQHRDADGNASPITVTRIESVTRMGAFLPLTPDGTLVVNGVQVSAYASVPHAEDLLAWLSPILTPHTIFHWWLAPLRMVCTSSLFTRDAALCQAYNEDGLLLWLDFGNKLAKYLSRCHLVLQSIAVLFVLLALSSLRFLEVAFGPTLGWVVLCGIIPVFIVGRKFLRKGLSKV